MKTTAQFMEMADILDSTIDNHIGIFKALGNSNRMKIIKLLSQHDELCVCEVVAALKHGQSLASYHLSILEKVGLITSRWEGTWTYHKLNKKRFREILSPQYYKTLIK